MAVIEDGSGSAFNAKVDANKRLHTKTIERTIGEESAILGDGYNINTGVVTLTGDGTKSAILYFKYTGERTAVIEAAFYLIGASTGGSGDILVTILRNPTAGTIVSDKTAVDMNANRNFDTAKTLSGDAYKGAEAKTFTDGTKIIESIVVGTARVVIAAGAITLKKGNSIGFDVTTAGSNSSMGVEIAIAIHEEDT